MLGSELAVRARRWSKIRERRDGRDGGGSDDSRFRRDSSGVEAVEEEAIGRSDISISRRFGYFVTNQDASGQQRDAGQNPLFAQAV
jgi:hypothetical protein